MNFRNMAIQFSFASNVCDAFLLSKMEINYERKEKQINNLKTPRNWKVV
jgi:hypothetical protein